MPGWCLVRMALRQQKLPGMGRVMRINEAALLILMRPLRTAGYISVVILWNAPDTWRSLLWCRPLIQPSQTTAIVWNWLVYSRSVTSLITSFFWLVTELGISCNKLRKERSPPWTCNYLVKVRFTYEPIHRGGVYPSFSNMKQPGIFLLPAGMCLSIAGLYPQH